MALTLHALFKDHPASVGEGYFEHMFFAGRAGLRLVGAGLAALVHAVFPFLCERTASNLIIAMHDDMVARRSTAKASEDQVQAHPA